MGSLATDLLIELMDFSELVGPDLHHPDFYRYHIEFPKKGIGVSVSARKIPSGVHAGQWEIRAWSPYNV